MNQIANKLLNHIHRRGKSHDKSSTNNSKSINRSISNKQSSNYLSTGREESVNKIEFSISDRDNIDSISRSSSHKQLI